jgi:hypothetical protein
MKAAEIVSTGKGNVVDSISEELIVRVEVTNKLQLVRTCKWGSSFKEKIVT